MLQAARLAASKIAVRAKVDLLFVVIVEDDDGRRGTEVGGDGIEEIDEGEIFVCSFGTSLSDKLFRLRVKFDCKIVERSGNNSLECSDSDRERVCLSVVLIVNGFREEERSSTSVGTNKGSDKDKDR